MEPKQTIQRVTSKAINYPAKPMPGFHYVSQANYCLVNIEENVDKKYLYSDSATSCIIVIVLGLNKSQEGLCALSHLSSPNCINAFFDHVINPNFTGPIWLYAQGANPPDAGASIKNANTLNSWISNYSNPNFGSWNIKYKDVHLKEGNPQEDNRGHLGVSLDYFKVTNTPYTLTLADRDSTGGQQSLFSIIGMQLDRNKWQNWLWNSEVPFPDSMVSKMVSIAYTLKEDIDDPETAFINIPNLNCDVIRAIWSTTPQFEACWFAPELVQAANYVLQNQ